MSTEERIMTLHPQGKKGVNILKSKYDRIKDFILEEIKEHGDIAYEDLSDLAEKKVAPTFDGKVVWYVVSVKLDLEARGIIERIPRVSPHRMRKKNKYVIKY